MTQERFALHLGLAPRTVSKWRERPCAQLRPSTCELLDMVLLRASLPEQQRFSQMCVERERLPVRPRALAGTELLSSAAAESARDATARAGRISASALPELVQDIMQISRTYDEESRQAAFAHALTTRDLAASLADISRRPSELADIYVTLGESNALMASLAFDLGNWPASSRLARAATSYAEMAGHQGLRAWALGLQATLAMWEGHGDIALRFTDEAMLHSPTAASRYRILHIAARAHAGNHDHDGALRTLRQAESEAELVDQQPDELHHVVAGEFRFDRARAAACAGAVWLKLGDAERAIEATTQSLDLITAGEPASTPTGVLNGARIDTAAALLLRSDVSAAEGFLRPVLDLKADPSNVSLGGRLRTVSSILTSERCRGMPHASELVGAVHEWLDEGSGSQ